MKVGDKSLLGLHLERIRGSKMINQLVIATTREPESYRIVEVAEQQGLPSYRGSTEDVLDRFYQAAKPFNPDYVVRITSDCPLIDPQLADQVIAACVEGNYDYCSNTLEPTYPDGMDVEVVKFTALETAFRDATLQSDREHVTPYVWRNSTVKGEKMFRGFSVKNDVDYSTLRLTVDQQVDFDLVANLVQTLGDDKPWKDYADFLLRNPAFRSSNAGIGRNEGYKKSLDRD